VIHAAGVVLSAHLEHPDALPRQREFPVQGWVTSRGPLRAAFVEGRTPAALELRSRSDVTKALPEAPYSSGFFGVAQKAHLEGGAVGVRFVFDSGTEVRWFELERETDEVLRSRARRLERVYPVLRCIRCLSGFAESGYAFGVDRIECRECKATYDCSQGLFDLLAEDARPPLALGSEGISQNYHDATALTFIHEDPGALILDCGAGLRQIEYPNVVNLEVVPYRTTDVLGDNERLPFKDASFDGVLSLAVLEHVRNPIACAKEICRVLKPGGKLLAVVPLIAPVHAYPHHYFNMTAEGLANLFASEIEIEDQRVPESGLPIWALVWILRSWAEGLPPAARASFTSMRVGELLGEATEYLDCDFVKELPREKNFELAGTTQILGRKRR
jgi:SAM-dependent methyltransferase